MALKKGSIISFGEQRVLVVAPHPDDEVLGCGGLMSRIRENGGEVHVLIMTVGDTRQYGGTSVATVRLRELKEAMKYLRIDDFNVALKGASHLKLDTLPQRTLIDEVETGKVSIASVDPTIVCIPYLHSTNQDHVAVSTAAFTACRPVGSTVKRTPQIVLSYEQPELLWSRRRFQPNFYIDISDHLDRKIRSLGIYRTQMRNSKHPRSLDSVKRMAELRGMEVGTDAAEAYECHRFLT